LEKERAKREEEEREKRAPVGKKEKNKITQNKTKKVIQK